MYRVIFIIETCFVGGVLFGLFVCLVFVCCMFVFKLLCFLFREGERE